MKYWISFWVLIRYFWIELNNIFCFWEHIVIFEVNIISKTPKKHNPVTLFVKIHHSVSQCPCFSRVVYIHPEWFNHKWTDFQHICPHLALTCILNGYLWLNLTPLPHMQINKWFLPWKTKCIHCFIVFFFFPEEGRDSLNCKFARKKTPFLSERFILFYFFPSFAQQMNYTYISTFRA